MISPSPVQTRGNRLPSGQSKAAQHPENHRMSSAAVARENEIVRDRRKEEGHCQSGEDQLLWRAGSQTVNQRQHDARCDKTAAKRRQRKRPDAQDVTCHRDDEDGTRSRAR